MGQIENRGIIIKKADDTAIRFVASTVDLTKQPATVVSTGNCHFHLFHQKPYANGVATPWEVYNWTTNVFEVPTNATLSDYETTATHISVGTDTLLPTGMWEVRLATLTDFESGHQYYWRFDHDVLGPFYGFFQYDAPPLEGAWYEAGACAVTATLTLADAVTPCPQVVWIVRTTTGVIQASGMTDEQGTFSPQLDPGTYYVHFGPDSRYTFTNPYTLIVAQDGETEAFTATSTVYPTQGMTFGELKAHVRFALADLNSTGGDYREFTDDLIETWVRQAHYKVDADLSWTKDRVTVNAVASQRYYTLEDGILEILQVAYDGTELARITVQEDIVKHDLDTSTGSPTKWAWWGDDLSFYPTPDSSTKTMELWVLKTPLAMTDNNERPSIPAQAHPCIVKYALLQAYIHAGDVERAGAYANLYEAEIREERHRQHALRGGNIGLRRDGRYQ